MNSHFGSCSLDGLPHLQRAISEDKTHWIEKFLKPLEISRNVVSKMGLRDSFRYLKHKLWPKEGLGVKLPI
jgi:hypothetical protein